MGILDAEIEVDSAELQLWKNEGTRWAMRLRTDWEEAESARWMESMNAVELRTWLERVVLSVEQRISGVLREVEDCMDALRSSEERMQDELTAERRTGAGGRVSRRDRASEGRRRSANSRTPRSSRGSDRSFCAHSAGRAADSAPPPTAGRSPDCAAPTGPLCI